MITNLVGVDEVTSIKALLVDEELSVRVVKSLEEF